MLKSEKIISVVLDILAILILCLMFTKIIPFYDSVRCLSIYMFLTSIIYLKVSQRTTVKRKLIKVKDRYYFVRMVTKNKESLILGIYFLCVGYIIIFYLIS